MAGEDAEICGFLDAKLPGNRGMTQRVRKRSLAPWKVWRRHWCSVRKLGPGLGIEVRLDCGISSGGATVPKDRDNAIKIPTDAIICRTESRSKQFAFGIFPPSERKPLLYLCGNSETESQRWMANLRQVLKPRRHRFMEGMFHVSMVDNAHSRGAGLTGLHGDLVASRLGVFVKDVNSGEIKESLEWKELSQFHLPAAGRPEDVKRICVIHTSKEFRGGVGELHLFCFEAVRLLQDFLTQGRGPRHKHLNERPLSLSEGDLRISIHNDGDSGTCPVLKSKVASSLISAGLGLLLSTRSGSEAKLLDDISENKILGNVSRSKINICTRAVDNVYQPEPASIPNIGSSLEELEEPCPRRVSNISVASGIYEEIMDEIDPSRTIKMPFNLYEDPEELLFGPCGPRQPPPPLPPRQRCGSGSTRNGSISDDGLDSEGGTRSATPSTQEDTTPTPTPEDKTNTNHTPIDNAEYVPMSPRLKDIMQQDQNPAQEDFYMIMR
ncbi:uncharacterized protein [Neodiprion pinetum]|uniref:Uncharacterized protein LOC107222089 n=1 Tax=Neodiprion lecontei TaxID=441921 RepID=A0A6J0BQH2_NEOLC|nr:uncharacterized protein LOC107222089 [Neodiprion lecontei]XP_046482612.1 uncharacterized protein LOC124219298 [Neodiprion pinetum]